MSLEDAQLTKARSSRYRPFVPKVAPRNNAIPLFSYSTGICPCKDGRLVAHAEQLTPPIMTIMDRAWAATLPRYVHTLARYFLTYKMFLQRWYQTKCRHRRMISARSRGALGAADRAVLSPLGAHRAARGARKARTLFHLSHSGGGIGGTALTTPCNSRLRIREA